MKRRPEELVEYLYRNNSFPHGCFLLTGTGVVPPDSFTLKAGDEIRITIPPIGTLVNMCWDEMCACGRAIGAFSVRAKILSSA